MDLEKYRDCIVKEGEDKVLMHCIFPDHHDKNRSAVYYKSTGIYWCPKCGKHQTGNKPQQHLIPKKDREEILYFDVKRHPLHYYSVSGEIKAANIQDGKVVGITTRSVGGYYSVKGKPGFRLHAKVITESLTDAIFLIAYGIDAGSICSTNNWRLVNKKHLYFPQNDKPGITTGIKIQERGTPVYWWEGKGDIREQSNPQTILDPLLVKQFKLKID